MSVDLRDAAEILEQVAARVARRYRAYTSKDDLFQEAWTHCTTHPGRMDNIFRDVDPADERSQRGALRRLSREVERVLERHARGLKADAGGYSVSDEFFYPIPLLEEILPALWSEDLAASAPVTERPEIKGSGSPQETANSWQAMVMDCKRAWGKADLSPEQRGMLRLRYGHGLPLQTVGQAYNMSRTNAATMIRNALELLAFELHGVRPAPECRPDCEHHSLV